MPGNTLNRPEVVTDPSTTMTCLDAIGDMALDLRARAIRALPRMFLPDRGLFAFRLRREGGRDLVEGVSPRYTAIVLIAAAGESTDTVQSILCGQSTAQVCDKVMDGASRSTDIGETGLALWAARLLGHPGGQTVLERLRALDPVGGRWPTVELAWCLTALSVPQPGLDDALAARLAGRLMATLNESTGLFAHFPAGGTAGGLRSHVTCFADCVYPVMAMSHYHRARGCDKALDTARRCADTMCALQGAGGQWWWHFDVRTGRVVERYPVYAVHQDAMGPMALLDFHDAGGDAHWDAVHKSILALDQPSRIKQSLIDTDADVIWRKRARREPGKFCRAAQALASRIHPGLRAPLTDVLFPPVCTDFESRPYHMGWILYAFSPRRMGLFESADRGQVTADR